jgi:small-conductance mechanosensitive channel
MTERRIVFTIGIEYNLPYEKVASAPALLREAVEEQEQARFDRAHFKGYGDSSLNYEIVYYVLSTEYAVYMDVQQAINLFIYKRFEENGIPFAFPTRTLHLHHEEAPP